MLTWVWGLVAGAVLLPNNGYGSWSLRLVVLLANLVLCRSGRQMALFAGGLIWFWYWFEPSAPRRCAESFWFLCESRRIAGPVSQWIETSWLAPWVWVAQTWLVERCLSWDPVWGPWALGLLGGRLDAENDALVGLYKELGLLHVLVISGSHFVFLSHIIFMMLQSPLRWLYCLRFIPFKLWMGAHLIGQGISWILMGFYAFVVGLPPPCQRAFLGSLVQGSAPLFFGNWSVDRCLKWTACLQALLFPMSFVSLSNALSWSACAVLRLFPGSGPLGAVPRELLMALISLAYFDAFSPIGIILNICLAPIWSFLLLAALVGITWQGEIFRDGIQRGLASFHDFLSLSAQLQRDIWYSQALILEGKFADELSLFAWLLSMIFIMKMGRGRTRDSSGDLLARTNCPAESPLAVSSPLP